MLHDVKVLETFFSEEEILEKQLGRTKDYNEDFSKSMSLFFCKPIAASIDWQSLYQVASAGLKSKAQFADNLLAYYVYVYYPNPGFS